MLDYQENYNIEVHLSFVYNGRIEKMKKICHMTSAHKSDDIRIFIKECSSLSEAGYETYLVAKGISRIQNGVKVIGVRDMPTNRIKRIFLFLSKCINVLVN